MGMLCIRKHTHTHMRGSTGVTHQLMRHDLGFALLFMNELDPPHSHVLRQ